MLVRARPETRVDLVVGSPNASHGKVCKVREQQGWATCSQPQALLPRRQLLGTRRRIADGWIGRAGRALQGPAGLWHVCDTWVAGLHAGRHRGRPAKRFSTNLQYHIKKLNRNCVLATTEATKQRYWHNFMNTTGAHGRYPEYGTRNQIGGNRYRKCAPHAFDHGDWSNRTRKTNRCVGPWGLHDIRARAAGNNSTCMNTPGGRINRLWNV